MVSAGGELTSSIGIVSRFGGVTVGLAFGAVSQANNVENSRGKNIVLWDMGWIEHSKEQCGDEIDKIYRRSTIVSNVPSLGVHSNRSEQCS